jgi:hypothetical protein
MKTKRREKAPVTKPLLKKLSDQHKASLKKQTTFKTSKQNPTVASDPLRSAELDQNPGRAYNSDDTFPQA